MPDGKYQRSPTPTSSMKLRPSASIAVMRALAVKHVGPFGRLMPMQLAHAAGVQPHVHAGNGLGDAQLAHGNLAGPAAGLQPHMSVGKREAQIRQGAVIGRGRHQQIRILPVAHQIARAGIGAAVAWPQRLRDGVAPLRVGCPPMVKRRRRLPPPTSYAAKCRPCPYSLCTMCTVFVVAFPTTRAFVVAFPTTKAIPVRAVGAPGYFTRLALPKVARARTALVWRAVAQAKDRNVPWPS